MVSKETMKSLEDNIIICYKSVNIHWCFLGLLQAFRFLWSASWLLTSNWPHGSFTLHLSCKDVKIHSASRLGIMHFVVNDFAMDIHIHRNLWHLCQLNATPLRWMRHVLNALWSLSDGCRIASTWRETERGERDNWECYYHCQLTNLQHKNLGTLRWSSGTKWLGPWKFR